MRRYETIVISDPDLSEDDRTALISRIKEIIPQQKGVFLQEDLWGVKKLAYEIKKKPRGYYTRFDYCGLGSTVDELERFFRIDDRVMKFLTVQLEPDADVEQIQAQIAAAQANAAAAQTPAAETVTKAESSPEQEGQSAEPADTFETMTESQEE